DHLAAGWAVGGAGGLGHAFIGAGGGFEPAHRAAGVAVDGLTAEALPALGIAAVVELNGQVRVLLRLHALHAPPGEHALDVAGVLPELQVIGGAIVGRQERVRARLRRVVAARTDGNVIPGGA